MIIWDNETTGLVGPSPIPTDRQPRIIELCAIKLDDKTLKEKGVIDVLIHPGIKLPEIITTITGIRDEDLIGKLPFKAHADEVADFFLGERYSVAHNNDADTNFLYYELVRLGRQNAFPWPPRRICTVEKTVCIKGHRLKLGELYELATGKKLEGAHRAINDVRALCESVRWCIDKGYITLQ